MKNYVEGNISHKSHTTVKYAKKMLSSSSETIIFMFLGVATINSSHHLNLWFIVLTIAFCSVYRAICESVLLAVCLRLPAVWTCCDCYSNRCGLSFIYLFIFL